MNLISELIEEGKKPQKRLPYDQYLLEKNRIEKVFSEYFSGEAHVDRMTLEIECPGDVSIKSEVRKFGHNMLPIKFGKVFGNFDVSDIGLETTQNFPYFVAKNFFAQNNKLRSLKGGPTYVGRQYEVSNNMIKNLDGLPEELYDDLDLDGNPLETLRGMPKMIRKDSNIYLTLPYYNTKPYGILRLPMLELNKVYFSPGPRGVKPENDKSALLSDIVAKQLNKGRQGVVQLQKDLMDNGFEEWAKFE